MKYDPEKHHRRSTRLKGYDYRRFGAYFITIVTQDRTCLFGEIVNGEMRLNDAGGAIEHGWFELNHKFPTVETDGYVVMPNHFHGIVVIANVSVGADLRVGPAPDVGPAANASPAPTNGRTARLVHTAPSGAQTIRAGAHTGAPLPAVIRWFKTMTTNEYIRGVKTRGWAPFQRRLWQRNYYEHVVRDEASLNRIRRYILENPAHWEFDRDNPAATTHEPVDAWRV